MGYSYGQSPSGRWVLCCDECGHAGGCRKIDCAYGYCPAVALCAQCRADRELRAKISDYCEAHCREASIEYAAQESRKADLLAAGEHLRRWASTAGDGSVDVGFIDQAGDEIVIRMPEAVYRSIPLGIAAIPSDYAAEVVPV